MPQVLGRERPRLQEQTRQIAGVDDASALLARAQADVDDVIGDADHFFVVLDDDDRVALLPQLLQDVDQPLVIARVEADGRLVQHVERADQRCAQRRRQVDSLRLAARERRRQSIERQVVEADVAQERQPSFDFAQHLVRDCRLFVRERELGKELLRLTDGQGRDDVDGATADAHVARFTAQPRAAAIGTSQVSAVAAEEDADVDFVFLPLEPAEESAYACVIASALDHEATLIVREVGPWHVEANTGLARRTFQLGKLSPVVRLGPRLDRAFVDRFGGVRHHEAHVELDDVAEPVARRAGTKRVVEREQARLRRLVGDAAGAAFEALREVKALAGVGVHRERGAAAFAVRRLDGVRQAAAEIAFDAEAVDDHFEASARFQRGGINLLEHHGADNRTFSDQQPAEPAAPQRLERFGRRVECLAGGCVRLVDRLPLVGDRRIESPARIGHDRDLEAYQQPRAGQFAEPSRHDLGRLADHLQAALPAEGAADSGKQQPHVVVDFGGRADRRTRIADAVLLADRDGRTDALDPIDVRLFHPLEELPRVGGERLDVAALPFGVDRVERQRRLSRAADTRDDDQLAVRQGDVDVLEVVRPGALDDERSTGPGPRSVYHPSVTNSLGNVREGCYYTSPSVTASRPSFNHEEHEVHEGRFKRSLRLQADHQRPA